ncbi:MAG: hypothetical protein ABIG44_01615 [Planctomycetota bacterium]
MFARIYNGLSIAAIATLLAGAGLVTYLVFAGHLTSERMQMAAAALRGDLDDQTPIAAEDMVAAEESDQPRGQSAAEVRAARQRNHLQSQMLERARCDVDARQRLLDQALQELLNEQEQFDDSKSAWSQSRRKMTDEIQDVGFEREVELVSGLPAKNAKAHIMRMWEHSPADAVRLVMRLDVGITKKILAQMKTPAEQEIMSQLLEQLRNQNPEGNATESGTIEGDAAP